MRKFSSYGPVNKDLHYYAPRTALVDQVQDQLLGDNPIQSGHYITLWAPPQTGKSWVMGEVTKRVKSEDRFEIGVISLKSAQTAEDDQTVLDIFVNELREVFDRDFPKIPGWSDISSLFTSAYFSKPVILVIDDFDGLAEKFINSFTNIFRAMYHNRSYESGRSSGEKGCLLHGLALMGVRSLLGIENPTGIPYNIQRSVHIPNLDREDVVQMFQDYQDESGQQIEPAVVARIYDEMQGQPRLICWFGALLTETHNRHDDNITMDDFEYAYARAMNAEPTHNVLHIISKANMEVYKPTVLEIFQADSSLQFNPDNPVINSLYMNGVLDREVTQDQMGRHHSYLKFSSPFIQKQLFNYFSHQLFTELKQLYDPLTDLSDTITDTHLNIVNIIRLYKDYLDENRGWLFKQTPRRRSNEYIYEAVYYFNFYMYLTQFLAGNATVVPEFPTGSGKIALVINHPKITYLLEIKNFINRQKHQEALDQAAEYAQQLTLPEAWLITFIEVMTDEQRASLEVIYHDPTTGVAVHPIFVTTG